MSACCRRAAQAAPALRARAEAEFAVCSPVVFALGLDFNPRLARPSVGAQDKRYQREAIMVRASLCAAALVSTLATPLGAQTGDFKPVTREMLANPPPAIGSCSIAPTTSNVSARSKRSTAT